jgi:hypothetical protein
MASKNILIAKGDKFKCKIFDENEHYFFLERVDVKKGEIIYYDIIMEKSDNFSKEIKIGAELNVKVNVICIADDGTPGLFVQL